MGLCFLSMGRYAVHLYALFPVFLVIAFQVLTLYHLKRRRAAVTQDDDSASPQPEVRPRFQQPNFQQPNFQHPNFQQPELHTDDMLPWDSLDGV